ncbi:hypothetical protein B0T17DRAFT_657446 [Bombardia bombarda]|uniref:Uncharacterized protein n=1 Tax=Bombardia bombarda TaxID=252184 RepID=A0AA39WH14_9PEZI|nr:hypothetical protein B0T17DRAFT_657446 [Bombardia bombarda]
MAFKSIVIALLAVVTSRVLFAAADICAGDPPFQPRLLRCGYCPFPDNECCSSADFTEELNYKASDGCFIATHYQSFMANPGANFAPGKKIVVTSYKDYYCREGAVSITLGSNSQCYIVSPSTWMISLKIEGV